MRGKIWVKNVLLVLMFILHTLPVYADESGMWCTETKFSNCLKKLSENSKRDLFVKEINDFLTIQNEIKCGITAKNLSDYRFWGKQSTTITSGCILSQNMALWMQDNCECDSSLSAYRNIYTSSTDSDYILFNNALGKEIFSQLQEGNISLNGTPVPTPLSSIPTPTSQSTPNPTPSINIAITGGPSFHLSKCGKKEAGYQCCYPNLEDGKIDLAGSFFDLFQGIWNTVQNFITSNLETYIGLGFGTTKDAIFQGGNVNLCPNSNSGADDEVRKQRFLKLGSTNWLDKEDIYDGNPDNTGYVNTTNNQELINYSAFLRGGTDPAGNPLNNGLLNEFLNQKEIPTEGINYKGDNYACFCANTNEKDELPDVYLNLQENRDLKVKADQTTFKKNEFLLGHKLEEKNVLSGSDYIGDPAYKICRNISDDNERENCKKCVRSDKDKKDLGGAWTAIGCIKADFSSTLQNTLFPLFISFGGLISLGCIIYASFLLQTSMGEPEKITKAQELMTSCITGLIVILFSIFILRVIGVDILRLPGLNQEAVSPTPKDQKFNVYSVAPVITNTGEPTVPIPTITPAITTALSTNSVTPVQPIGTNLTSNPNSTTGPNITSTPTPTLTPVPTAPLADYECGVSNEPMSNEVYLYDDIDYKGACLRLDKNEDNLANVRNSKTNSFLSNFFGACNSSYNDCIASFKVGDNVKVSFYTDVIGDEDVTLETDWTLENKSFFSNPPFNDRTSAVRLSVRQ